MATLVGSANACIYGYEKGALLTDDTPAPERRVLFFMTDNVAAALNADGFKLFDAALNWAQNLSVAPPQTLPPRITSATISAGRITIQWSNGGTLEYATSLNSPINWTPTGNSSGTFSEPAAGTKFYRVKQSP